MNLTNEQIEQILDGAPDGATHWTDDGIYTVLNNAHGVWMVEAKSKTVAWVADDFGVLDLQDIKNLSDLREILTLRQRVVELEQRNNELAATVERLRDSALAAICIMPSGCAKADLRDAYDETPQQSLAEHDAEVAWEAYYEAILDSKPAPHEKDAIELAKKWADEYVRDNYGKERTK